MPTPVPVRRCLLALLGAFATLLPAVLLAAPAEARTLTEGARGGDVRALQQLLRRAGFPGTRIDGVFGHGTYRTVRRLERELGLTVDGRVTSSEVRRIRLALKPAQGTGGFSTDAMNRPRAVSAKTTAGPKAQLTADGLAIPPADAPQEVKDVIAAGNEIATTPYKWGGGHGRWKDTGYDCSGSVSYALHGGGLLDAAMPSGSFEGWGDAGEGDWITLYANGGHIYMVVAGLRFDTSGRSASGSRWQRDMRSGDGYVVRHPDGF